MSEDRLSIRLDAATRDRLAWLTHTLEASQSFVVRMAVRELTIKLGGEQGARLPPPPPADA